MIKLNKKVILYSGGYESVLCAFLYPEADKLFLSTLDTSKWLEEEMRKQGCIIYKTNLPHNYVVLQGIMVAQRLGYRDIIVGAEKDTDYFRYQDVIEFNEVGWYFWQEKKRRGINIHSPVMGMTHTEVIKEVKKRTDKFIFTCDRKPEGRCGRCCNCKIENKVLKESANG